MSIRTKAVEPGDVFKMVSYFLLLAVTLAVAFVFHPKKTIEAVKGLSL